MMAGAAGEQLYFGQLSTGVEGDLDKASKLARSMVVAYGMSEEFGPVSIGERAGEVFLGRDIANMGNVSPIQQERIENEVRRLVTDAFELAQRILRQNASVVDEMVSTLVEHETLSGVALEAMLAGVDVYDGDLSPKQG
jgi:cell division protease FtsH